MIKRKAITLSGPWASVISTVLALLSGAAGSAQPVGDFWPRVIEIGAERQLFLDDHLIDRMDRVSRLVNPPVKEPRNPLFRTEKPWEWKRVQWLTVDFDQQAGLFKFWYSVYVGGQLDKPGIAYATSKDGLHFERPNLGLVEFNGSNENNLVAAPPDMSVPDNGIFIDPHDPDAARRYKMVYLKKGTSGVSVAWSPDGLTWTRHENNPVITPTGDAGPKPFWDTRQKRYVMYHRPDGHHVRRWNRFSGPEDFPTRRIGRAESLDFKTWTDIEEEIVPDAIDGGGIEFYSMAVLPYEGIYVGFLNIFTSYVPAQPGKPLGTNSTLYIQLTASRDGRTWTRLRRDFLIGDSKAWDENRVYIENAIVRGDEIWMYYRGSNIRHVKINEIEGQKYVHDALGLARIRLDGFASIDASSQPGSLLTWPLAAKAQRGLVVNAEASAGEIRVEVSDRYGEPIPGLTREDCPPLTGDSVRQPVVWKSGKTLADAPAPFRLRFVMKNAKLYSFQVTD